MVSFERRDYIFLSRIVRIFFLSWRSTFGANATQRAFRNRLNLISLATITNQNTIMNWTFRLIILKHWGSESCSIATFSFVLRGICFMMIFISILTRLGLWRNILNGTLIIGGSRGFSWGRHFKKMMNSVFICVELSTNKICATGLTPVCGVQFRYFVSDLKF